MEYKKVPQDINDFTNDNLKALSELFPSVIKDGQVDFDALKEELGQFEEVGGEKYELTWSGKQNAKRKAQEKVLGRTLNYIEEDSKNPDTTQNLYIEGDNLEVLKLLRQNYYGSVKMIYIDPPYNTGNDFVYNDNFKMNAKESDIAEGLVSEEGERLQKNLKSTNRYHANWLNMMYPRLKVARDLLTDDGVIFISIFDQEVDNLLNISKEIFCRENFITTFLRQKKKKPSYLHSNVGSMFEYILCFARNRDLTLPFSVDFTTAGKKYPLNNSGNSRGVIEFSPGSVFFSQESVVYESQDMSEGNIITRLLDKVVVADHRNVGSFRLEGEFRYSQRKLEEIISQGDIITISKSPFRPNHVKSGGEVKKMHNFLTPETYNVGTNEDGSAELESIFNSSLFDNPKPSSLIRVLCQALTYNDANAIILDFFSGSATTAHAVMQLNAEDGGNRRFIMVQLPESCDENSEAYKAGYKNICEIGKERIRRAGERIKEEIEGENGQLKLGEDPKKVPDIGFKVFRASDTNIKWNLVESDHGQLDLDSIKDNPDVMDFTSNAKDVDVVYEIMLRQKDVPLSESMEVLSHIGNRTYLYGSSYLICLETEVTEGMVDKLASIDPLPIKFVFRDSAFKDDISLKDETFRRLEGLIAKNSGDVKKTYTVEFI